MTTAFGTALGGGDESYSVGVDVATAALENMETDRVDFCQVFASPEQDYAALLSGIRSVIGEEAVLIGCSSAGAFTDQGETSGGVAVGLVTSDEMEFFSAFGTGLGENVGTAIRDAARELPMSVEGYPYLSGIALHDGLVGAGEEIALETQRVLGQQISFAGGSAGDDLDLTATHVFHGDQVMQDAVVVALVASTQPTAITVDHGHEPISEPMEVTGADGAVVHELDGRPAAAVWRDAIRDHARDHLDIDIDTVEDERVLADLTLRYQFGIDQGDGEYKIRWPGLDVPTAEDDHLRFAAAIPEGTVLRVTASTSDAQIESVRRAVEQARTRMRDADVAGGFVYECACRSAILGEEFADALGAIESELDSPFAGVETYGELCMERGELSGYHNTTSVIMLFPA